MFGAVASFERKLMLERQREGIAKARSDGRYAGRKPRSTQGDAIFGWVTQFVDPRPPDGTQTPSLYS